MPTNDLFAYYIFYNLYLVVYLEKLCFEYMGSASDVASPYPVGRWRKYTRCILYFVFLSRANPSRMKVFHRNSRRGAEMIGHQRNCSNGQKVEL